MLGIQLELENILQEFNLSKKHAYCRLGVVDAWNTVRVGEYFTRIQSFKETCILSSRCGRCLEHS